jgi:predicted metal-dependent phosphoesterase TrpH
MAKADLHMHTTFNDGMITPEKLVETLADRGELSIIAVTDHDHVGGAYRAQAHAKKRGLKLQVVIGTEVSTRHGHIVGLFVEKAMKKFMSAEDTIAAIHAQGGLAIAAHPMNFLTASLKKKKILDIVAQKKSGIYFDAIETASSYPFFDWMEKKVKDLNAEIKLPELGASDAHFPWEHGTSFTEFEGETVADLREAIRRGTTIAKRVPVPFKKYLSPILPYQMLRSWTWKSPFWPWQEKD